MTNSELTKMTRILLCSLLVGSLSYGAPAELDALKLQYAKVREEKVVTVHTAGMTQLESAYLAGVERGLAEAKTAGDLPTVLGLEAEKKRIAAKEAMPSEDDEKTVPALKKLRAVYRQHSAVLETQRKNNESPLLAAYTASLKKLEADLTKANRVEDAKAVLDYRASFGSGGLPATSAPPAIPAANPTRFKEGTDTTEVIRSVEKKLQGKKWSYPRNDLPEAKQFVEFQPKNILHQGWSGATPSGRAQWKVVGETMVELQQMYGDPQHSDVIVFDPSFRTGTITFPGRGEHPIKLLRR
jgi:hypothetical protein